MRCDARRSCMSDSEALTDEAGLDVNEELDIQPNDEQIELALRIITRLNPRDRAALGEMIHSRSMWVGGILATYAVFWWLAVLQVKGDDVGADSIFFGPTFLTVTILAPSLVFLGSILSDFSRSLGQLFPGLVSGIMYVFVVLYVSEPAILAFFSDSLTTSEGLWRFARLLILSTTMLIAAKLLIDAVLLGWVKHLFDAYPTLDFIDDQSVSNTPDSDLESGTEA
jgi:hypothetical protein